MESDRKIVTPGNPVSRRGLPIFTACLPAAALALLMVATPVKAHADITWTLSGVAFPVGGEVTGTFVTSDFGIAQSWDLKTTAGGNLPAQTYDSAAGSADLTANQFGFELTGDLGGTLNAFFAEPLTLQQSPDYLNAVLETEHAEGRSVLGAGVATVVVPAVPEPTSLALLASALGLYGLRRGRVGARISRE